MTFDVLTLFPEMFDSLKSSVIGKGIEKGLININLINIRDFSKNKHKKVDDYPYGGGAGMVIRPDVVYDAYMSVVASQISTNDISAVDKSLKNKKSKVIYLSPQGQVLTQKKVKELAKEDNLILLCGHYEGVDQRVIDKIVDEEISIGDYIVTGGEIPAMVLIDAISRNIDGVINTESITEESFSDGLLEYPQYTRPEQFLNEKVPEVLLSGHHANIEKWRKEQSIKNTKKKRKELLK